jgi:hypothetical protein
VSIYSRISAVGGRFRLFDLSFPFPGAAETPFAPDAIGAIGASNVAPSATTSTSAATSAAVTSLVGSASQPAWISTLSTASIAVDMAAADVNGTVSAAGLARLLGDLAATLASGSTLTSAEFADLKTIVANLNNGLSTSAYLVYVFSALVNGNSANASWMGGGASAVALGNLGVGSSATQLSELTGKWLLGTDLPSSTVSMSGSSSFSITYSTVTKPLFGASGPSVSDINQGYLGDCYFLAGCAELASQNAAAISSMFVDNGNGTYGVRFFVNGAARYVTVNAALANGGSEFNHASNIWASLAEKAWAQLQASGLDTGNSSANYGNSYSTIGNGGDPAHALEALTGASQLTEYWASGSSWTKYTLNSSMSWVSQSSGQSTASVLNTIIAALNAHDDVILSSYTDATDSAGRTTLVSNHAMSIYGYDSVTGNLQIRNPWGASAYGQYWDTTFEVSLSTLLAAGDGIVFDNAGASYTQAWSGAISGAAAYIAANIDAINAATGVTAITLTDSGIPALALTATQAASDARALGLITNQAYEVTVGSSATFHVQGNGATGTLIQIAASNALIAETNASAAVTGGGDTISFSGAASNRALLAGTGSNWDLVLIAGGGSIFLSSALANIYGGGATVDFYAGTGNAAMLSNTGASWDLVLNAGGGAVYLNSAQANIDGGGAVVDFYAGTGNAALLSNTGSSWDLLLNAAGGAVYLNSAQANIDGGGAVVDFYAGAGNSAMLSNTGGSWDLVLDPGKGVVYLNSAQANVYGGGATVNFYAGTSNAAILTNTGSSADTVTGNSGALYLSNANVNVQASGDTITFSGNNNVDATGSQESFKFGAAIGVSSITGFNATDSMTFASSDFASWNALLGHMTQQGANTVIALDANNVVTLANTQMASLTASQFHFAA